MTSSWQASAQALQVLQFRCGQADI